MTAKQLSDSLRLIAWLEDEHNLSISGSAWAGEARVFDVARVFEAALVSGASGWLLWVTTSTP